MRSADRTRLLAAFAVTYLVWGSTYGATAVAVRTLPPLTMTGVRFLVAGAALTAWCAVQRRRGRLILQRDAPPSTRRPGLAPDGNPWPAPGRRQWAAAAVVGLLMPAAATGGASWAVQFLPSHLAALLLATIPLWIAVAAAAVDGERITAVVLLGLLLGLVGTAVLADPFASGSPALVPTLVCLAGAACWGVGTIVSRRVPLPRQPLLASGMEMLCAGGVLLVVGAATGEWPRIRPETFGLASVVAFLYLIVAGSMLAYSAFGYLAAHAPTRLVGTYAFVNPLVAVAIGAALLGERLEPRTLLAAALVVAGVAVLVLAPRPRE